MPTRFMRLYTINGLVVHGTYNGGPVCSVPWIADCNLKYEAEKWFVGVGFTTRLSLGVIPGPHTYRLLLGPMQLTYHRKYKEWSGG